MDRTEEYLIDTRASKGSSEKERVNVKRSKRSQALATWESDLIQTCPRKGIN